MIGLTLNEFARGGAIVGMLVGGGCAEDGWSGDSATGGRATTGASGSDASQVSTTATVTATGAGPAGDETGGPQDADEGSDASGTDGDATGIDGSGSGDDGGSGSDGASMPGEPCLDNDDCVRIDDCCTCAGASADAPAPRCNRACEATACEVAGLPDHAVECRFGTCELVDVECNLALVLCDLAPPECAVGMLPSVVAGCWSGACVTPEACDYVPDCGWCSEREVCVPQYTQIGRWSICEPIDPGCGEAEPTCACMGDAVCQAPYECVPDEIQPFGCSCLACG